MAICNLFNKITNPTGTFFTFSQYTEDLTKAQTNPGYKVTPSKFICFEIDYSKWDDINFPTFLQNNIENGAAFLRSNHEEYNADHFKQTFWDEIINNTLINRNDPVEPEILSEAVYCGDINIQSYSEQDGMGYSEIYCYIPNDAQKQIVKSNTISSNNREIYNSNYVVGYDTNDATYLSSNACPIDCVFKGGTSSPLINHNYLYNSAWEYDMAITTTDDTSVTDKFEFNTVLVLYNVSYYDSETEKTIWYEDIPLGLYITGTIDVSGVVNNSITKYISNDDIYSSGTSYGLRICSRITPTQNGTYIRTETTVDDLGVYESLTQAMSSMIDSQAKMDDVLGKLNEHYQVVTNHLAEFKNSKVNVPYIKQINGVDYWFVNGKNTKVEARGDGSCYIDTSKGVSKYPTPPSSKELSDPAEVPNIVSAYGFKTGDYTIAYDTGDIYVYDENIFKQSVNVKGAPGRDGSHYIDTSVRVGGGTGPTAADFETPSLIATIVKDYNFIAGDYTIAHDTSDIYVYDGTVFNKGVNIKNATDTNIFSHLSDSGQLLNNNVINIGDPLTKALSVVDNTEYLEFHIDLNNIELLLDKYYIIDTTGFSTNYSEGYKLHIYYASDDSTKLNNYKKFYIFILNNSSNAFNSIKIDDIPLGRYQEKSVNLKGNSLVTLDLFNIKGECFCKISAEDGYELI